MRSSKIDRALYGPSLFEVTLGALLSILLGAVLAVVFMVLKPVLVVKEPPKEEERVQGAVYFVQGSVDPSRSRQWIRKRQMLMEGLPGQIAFSEEELNAWLSSGAPKKDKKPAKPAAKPATPPKPGAPKQAPEPEVADELLTLETPNVRIRNSIFQIGVPGSLNIWTFSLPVVLQSQGKFDKDGDLWVFKPDTFYLGSMPLHRIPGFTEELVKRLMSSSLIPEDALASWKRVSDVTVDGKALKVTIEGETAAPPTPAPSAKVPAPPAPVSPAPAATPAPEATTPTPATTTTDSAATPAAPATVTPAPEAPAPTSPAAPTSKDTPAPAAEPTPTPAPAPAPTSEPAPASTTPASGETTPAPAPTPPPATTPAPTTPGA